MKKNCEFCALVEKGSDLEVYQDDEVMAVLASEGTGPGHIKLFTKEHFTIFEHVPDFEAGNIFTVANKLSTAAFEALGKQGTNIIVTNGVAAGQKHAHFLVNIIPRDEGDGLNFDWAPKQLSEEEMSTVELKLKEHTEGIGKFVKEKQKKAIQIGKSKPVKVEKSSKEENYLLRQLNRIP